MTDQTLGDKIERMYEDTSILEEYDTLDVKDVREFIRQLEDDLAILVYNDKKSIKLFREVLLLRAGPRLVGDKT